MLTLCNHFQLLFLLDFHIFNVDVQDQFDTIDLSDNEIVKLENFPYLNRLGTLLMNNNRITRINPNIGGEMTHHPRPSLIFCSLEKEVGD